MTHNHDAKQGKTQHNDHDHGSCGHDHHQDGHHKGCSHSHGHDDNKAPQFHIAGQGHHQFLARYMPQQPGSHPFSHLAHSNDHHGACSHDHHNHGDDHSTCSHGHHDHYDHDHNHDDKPVSYNHGLLKYAFSKVSGEAGEWLQRHRRKILLGAAAATAAIEYKLTSSTTLSSLGLLFAGAAVAHDASEDIMEVTGELKDSQNLSSGVVGTAVGFTHTLSEGMFSLFSTVQGNSDMAVSSVMGSNASHILLMAGGAAVIGSVGAGQSTKWKLHAAGIAGLTGAFSYQIATGEFNPVLGAGMAAGGLYYLYQRVTSGESCVIHGDACGGNHDHGHAHAHDHHGHDHDHHHHGAEEGALTLRQRLADPRLLQLGGSVAALTTSAHILGHQVLAQSENMGISETAAGAGIAALALAAPEIILTWKAAHKGDRDMAWGAITGCTVATVGVVGGALAMSGIDVPANLDITTTEGQIHMAAFAGSAAAIIGATHPKVIKAISKDGGSLPKWFGGAFLAAGLSYYAAMVQPNCHFHGPRLHCDTDVQSMPAEYLELPGIMAD